jgi:uncharacterized small protein (TIGR04563 family)
MTLDPNKRKKSFYLSKKTLAEIQTEATRLDRNCSWLLTRAWDLAKKEIQSLPTMPSIPKDP